MKEIKEMMAVWKIIENKAKIQFPNATKEELYKICSDTMKKQLGV